MKTTNLMNIEVTKLVAANNTFGFQLLSQLVKEDIDQNVFISSFSIAIALAMAYNGAEGAKHAMAETLGLTGLSLQDVNVANAAFMTIQNRLDPQVQLAIANSIWARNEITLSPDFIQRIGEYYAGTVANVNFSDATAAADIINRWVADKTHQKITELVTPPLVRGAILILLNAIYFKGIWTTQFEKDRTQEGAFVLPDGSHKQHPMMVQSGCYAYYETDVFQAVSLPYGNGRVSMYIFLPKPTVSLQEFQNYITDKNWRQWMARFVAREGEIVFPRFKVEYEKDLLQTLIDLSKV